MLRLPVFLAAALGVVALASSSSADRPDAQTAYLAKLVRAVPSSRIVSAKLGQPSARNVANWTASARWVFVTIRDVGPLDGIYGTWQAGIVAGLLAQETHARGWRRILGEDITFLEADGRRRLDSSYVFCFPGDRLPCLSPVHPVSRARLVQLATMGATAAGVTLERVRVWSMLGHSGVEIAAVTGDPNRLTSRDLWAIVDPIMQTGKRRPLAEGTFVRVTDTIGREIGVLEDAGRTGASGGGTINDCPDSLLPPPGCH